MHWSDWVKKNLKNSVNQTVSSIILDNDRGKIPLEKCRFNILEKTHPNVRLAVVDGGSAPIFQSHGFVVYLLKVYGEIYENGKCSYHSSEDTIAIAKSIAKNKISVSLQKSFSNVIFRKDFLNSESLASAINQVRSTMEITTARNLLKKLDSKDILILDGSLVPITKYDQSQYFELFEKVKERKIVLLGLSKTSGLLCDSGVNAIYSLNEIQPKNTCWWYRGEGKTPITHFVKLNKLSHFSFRLDSNKPLQKESLDNLIYYSSEPSFIGYPFPLIRAHNRAKINSDEIKLSKNILKLKLGRTGENITESISGHDSIDIT